MYMYMYTYTYTYTRCVDKLQIAAIKIQFNVVKTV